MTEGANATTRDATLSEALDLLPLGACVIARDLTVRVWNEMLVDWTGIAKHQAVGMNLGALYPHLLDSRYFDRLQQVFSGGNPAVYSAALHKHFFPVSSTGVPGAPLMIQQTQVRPLASDPDCALVTVENVTTHYQQLTDLRAGRARAEAANRAKSEFLANMSHEIRTPMTAILGFAEALRDDDLTSSEVRDAVDTIRRNGEHLMHVINDILDLSKIESGKLEIERLPCSPRQLILEVCALMQVRADEKNLPFVVDFAAPLPRSIQTDPTRLRQVLINLVGNALKFTLQGRVRVAAQVAQGPDGRWLLQVDVVDTGVGMTPSQLEKLFRPFTQADSSTTRMFGGTGLGLTISKRLANLLGGDIVVSSQPRSGSTFRLTVDAGSIEMDDAVGDPCAESATPTHAARNSTSASLDGCHILLAEDGQDNQRLISFILARAGAETTVAENGLLAYEAARQADAAGRPFDLVLMDMQMPVLDGYDAARRLRDAGYAGAIIALTAHAMSGDREKCLAAGCDDFVTKPISREQLFDVLARHVSKGQSTASIHA